MKVLLLAVNAKYIHSNLAVYSLKAYAGKEGYQTEILECTINQSKDQILKGIYERKPDLLCVSCYIWNISYIEEILSDAKKVLPDVPIWVGGPEVSYDAEAFLERHKEVKGVMCGEGEKTLTSPGYHQPSYRHPPLLLWKKEELLQRRQSLQRH